MSEGPLGGPRPLVKTHLKYTVRCNVPEGLPDDPPKARDVLDITVSAVQDDVISATKRNIGKVIMACNNLAHPSRYRVILEERESHQENTNVPQGEERLTWTYVMQGSGAGEFADEGTSSTSAWKIHEVLIEGNDEPITRSQAIREFDSGPIDIQYISITT